MNPRRVDGRLLEAAAITVVAFVAILLTAPDGMWLDETISVRRSGLPLTTLTSFSLQAEPNMALFHYVLWPLGQLHAPDTVFRLVPIAAGSLILGATYLIGCRLFDRVTAVVATAMLAVHGLTTRYATEVRGYSLLVLLTLFGVLLLRDAITRNRRRSWILYAVVSIASFGLHFVAVMFVFAQLITLAAVWRTVDRRRAIALLATIAAAVGVLGIIWLVSDQEYWVAWLPPLSDERALAVTRALAGGTTVALVIVGALAVVGSVASISALRADRDRAWGDAWLLSGVWVPLVLGIVASYVHPLAYPRYFLAVLPPLALLVARGILALPRRPTVAVAATAILLAAVVVGHEDLDRQAREGMDVAADYLVEHAQPGDGVFLPYNENLSGFQWYVDGRLPAEVVDVRPGVPAAAIRDDWWWEDPDRLGPDMPELADLPAEQWRDSLEDVNRVWVVSGFIALDPRFYDRGIEYVQEGREACDRQVFRGIDVVLWARDCG